MPAPLHAFLPGPAKTRRSTANPNQPPPTAPSTRGPRPPICFEIPDPRRRIPGRRAADDRRREVASFVAGQRNEIGRPRPAPACLNPVHDPIERRHVEKRGRSGQDRVPRQRMDSPREGTRVSSHHESFIRLRRVRGFTDVKLDSAHPPAGPAVLRYAMCTKTMTMVESEVSVEEARLSAESDKCS